MQKRKALPVCFKSFAVLFFMMVLTCSINMNVRAAETLKLTKGCKYYVANEQTEHAVWVSSNPAVLKVTGNGVVKAVKKGSAKLTATVNGSEAAVYSVKVITFKPVKMTKLKCYKSYRKYMTAKEFKKAYDAACKVVKPYAGFSKKDQLYAIAQELRYIFEKYGTYSMTKKHYNDPYGYLVKHTASCAGCARATGLCLNILGIKFEHVNENKYKHQWCRVKVGKAYWICDAYGLYVGKEPGKRKHPYL